MNNKEFIGFICLAVVALIVTLHYYQLWKLKNIVRINWGYEPSGGRFDSEESLKKAWLIEKNFHHFDSEIDELTWKDLDMFAVFQKINLTYSSVGSEALYQKLRNFDFKEEVELEQLIQFYQEHPGTREKIQLAFARLGKQDENASKYYLSEQNMAKIGSLAFFILLGSLPLVGILVTFLNVSIGVTILLASLFFNMFYYYIKKLPLETELNSMRYLVQTVTTGIELSKIDHPLQKELQTALENLKSIARFAFSFRAKNGSETDMFLEYLNILFMLPFISYSVVIAKLARHRQAAIQLWDLMGKLEVAASVLNFRTYEPTATQPHFVKEALTGQEVIHPLLKTPVGNPVSWHKTTLVTGSNASGKSTYVKSIAINCILAQTIQTVLAEKIDLAFGHVLTSMAIKDDLFEGDSYFVAEVKSVKRLLDKVASQEPCYCFVDEILKGTNTIERIAASSSVVHWLSESNSLAIVATHDIELTEILKEQCENIHFSERVDDIQGIRFDYLVKKGPARSRNAIALLHAMDYPSQIVNEAKTSANFFDEHRYWPLEKNAPKENPDPL